MQYPAYDLRRRNQLAQGITERYTKDAATPGTVDGFEIIDGKVDGKIPVEEYKAIREFSVKNSASDTLTLGRYADDATSYTVRAGDTSYFDMGDDWDAIRQQYDLSLDEMFEYFNKPVLEGAVSKGKIIRFSHDPRPLGKSFLVAEWTYIKKTLDITDSDLMFEGGFWHVRLR